MNKVVLIFCILLPTIEMSKQRHKRLVFDMIPKYEYEECISQTSDNVDLYQMRPKLENTHIHSHLDLRNLASLSKRSSDKTERKEKEIQKKQILRQKFEMWKLRNYEREQSISNSAIKFKTDSFVITLFLIFLSINQNS